jgi:ABC-type multidrug transport system ATPase subunit
MKKPLDDVQANPRAVVELHGLEIERRGLRIEELAFDAGITVVLGPNGSGKSTLLHALFGLGSDRHARGQRGQVTFQPVVPGRPRVCLVPQSPRMPRNLRVAELLDYVALIRGSDRGEVATAIQRFRLDEVRSRKPQQLSGGQRQRLLLAIAMIGQPEVLLLDEPTAGLDPLVTEEFLDLLAETVTDVVVVMTTHLPTDIRIADRVVILERGRVRWTGRGSDFDAIVNDQGASFVNAYRSLLENSS